MKTPRIEDFDPKATPVLKSPMDNLPTIEKQVSQSHKINTNTNERTNVRMMKRTNERSEKREKVRHSFDIFIDQLPALKQIALTRELATGDRVPIGDLVQEALDAFITNERTNEHTK